MNRLIIESSQAQSRLTLLYENSPVLLLLALLFGCGLIWFCLGRAATATGGYSLTLREANNHKILLITVGSETTTLDPQESAGGDGASHHHGHD